MGRRWPRSNYPVSASMCVRQLWHACAFPAAEKAASAASVGGLCGGRRGKHVFVEQTVQVLSKHLSEPSAVWRGVQTRRTSGPPGPVRHGTPRAARIALWRSSHERCSITYLHRISPPPSLSPSPLLPAAGFLLLLHTMQ